MQNWQYDYKKLLQEMDTFSIQIADEAFSQVWLYTKKMIQAHAEAMRPELMSHEEALSLAWSQFESTFDEQDDEAILSLAGIVIHLVNTVPLGKTRIFHDAIEIAFTMARGFSREEAIEEHQSIVQEVNAMMASPYTSSTSLMIVEGGKS